MAVIVVDVLEVVEVDEREREAPLPPRPWIASTRFRDQDAIGKPGQFVEEQALRQLDFDLHAIGDVDRGRDLEGLAGQANAAAVHLQRALADALDGIFRRDTGCRAGRRDVRLGERRLARMAELPRGRFVDQELATVLRLDRHADRQAIEHGGQEAGGIDRVAAVPRRRLSCGLPVLSVHQTFSKILGAIAANSATRPRPREERGIYG